MNIEFNRPTFRPPKTVVGRLGTEFESVSGRVVGLRRCTLEGCNGTRIGVRWPDGRITWPCSKGMDAVSETEWRIA